MKYNKHWNYERNSHRMEYIENCKLNEPWDIYKTFNMRTKKNVGLLWMHGKCWVQNSFNAWIAFFFIHFLYHWRRKFNKFNKCSSKWLISIALHKHHFLNIITGLINYYYYIVLPFEWIVKESHWLEIPYSSWNSVIFLLFNFHIKLLN